MEPNPYESPFTNPVQEVRPELRRPPMGTVLIVIWMLEGALKVCFVGSSLLHGHNLLRFVAEIYRDWNPFLYFLAASFMIVETIGPWIGIYFLSGQRAKTIPFDKALLLTLMVAGAISVVGALTLIAFCECFGSIK